MPLYDIFNNTLNKLKPTEEIKKCEENEEEQNNQTESQESTKKEESPTKKMEEHFKKIEFFSSIENLSDEEAKEYNLNKYIEEIGYNKIREGIGDNCDDNLVRKIIHHFTET